MLIDDYLAYKGIKNSLKDDTKRVFASQKSFKEEVIILFREVNTKRRI